MMNSLKFGIGLTMLIAFLTACNSENSTSATEGSATESTSASNVKSIEFVDTQEGKPLVIDAALFDTPAAKEFLTTGNNVYIGNEEAIAKGKKVFQLYSCTQCHGPEAKGQVGPGLTGPNYKYPKNSTDKGMFETVWHGTNGGMGAKGVGLMDPTDPKNGITPDELLKIIAWVRSMGAPAPAAS
ncbi:MAG: cytochrome C [Methylophilales bacterium 16-45-7]|jgi:cytochrome c-L|nr:MAG: cytochrome C [Methylophilales bacterium 16-45-7]